jgi:lysophospholipid acyltransferase (LPLAT)-like uncharacterized protein
LKRNFSKLFKKYARKVYDFFRKRSGYGKFEPLAAKAISIFMKLSYITTRWTTLGKNIPDEYHKSNKPFVVCLWHDRLMVAPCVWKWKKPLHVLASAHKDGRLISKVVENFSMPAVYGSTGKGIAALKALVKISKAGEYVAIIPDGPNGPRHMLTPGVIALAKLANVDILTYSFCVKRYYRFNSWDKFIFVWPFNRGVMIWGEPITHETLKNLPEGEAVKLVENRINDLSKEAYRILND